MISIGLFICFAIAEAILLSIFFTWNEPTKESKENLREFANEHNISINEATEHIFRVFFEAYENGLREKMQAAHQESIRQDFERWRKEREQEMNPPKPKQVVKPTKKTRSR